MCSVKSYEMAHMRHFSNFISCRNINFNYKIYPIESNSYPIDNPKRERADGAGSACGGDIKRASKILSGGYCGSVGVEA